MSTSVRFIRLPLAVSALAAFVLAAPVAGSAAQAATLAALSGDATVTLIDSARLSAIRTVTITGLDAPLLGIDLRPADKMLYGLTRMGSLVTIDLQTGRAMAKAKLSEPAPSGMTAVVDFNPAADRLRVIGADGTNYRINVDDGKVAVDKPLSYAAGDLNAGQKPMVVAGAYTNSFAGTKETTLYDIDARTGAYARQAPPNDGILNSLTRLTADGSAVPAFDIRADGAGGNQGMVMMGGKLYALDPASGTARDLGAVRGAPAGIRDLAVLD